ncbi:MAG TPA: hypothetical protein VMS76_09175 [Planctomycetota bacterium]|nr:hypothetical protein [Planctomycetota bacterium]
MTEAQYVRRLLQTYRTLPHTTGRVRPADRTLATRLFREGLPIDLACTALRVAISRRQARPNEVEPLPLIRSLHYFLPLFEEARSLQQGYLDYAGDRQPK